MKKIVIGILMLLTVTVQSFAEETVSKVTHFPVSYAGYQQVQATNLDVGVGKKSAKGELGKSDLGENPLKVTGQTQVNGDLTLNGASSVEVGGNPVTFGGNSGKNSKVTFEKNVRLGSNAKFKNLNADVLKVGTLKLGSESKHTFPNCTAASGTNPDGSRKDNMHWAKLRLAKDGEHTCKWHLVCGDVPSDAECTGNEGGEIKTCNDWLTAGKRCPYSITKKSTDTYFLSSRRNIEVEEDKFEDECCGKTCAWWHNPNYTDPILTCPDGFAVNDDQNILRSEVIREQYGEKCCKSTSVPKTCGYWRQNGKSCPKSYNVDFHDWTGGQEIEKETFTHNCCARFTYYWEWRPTEKYTYSGHATTFSQYSCRVAASDSIRDNCHVDDHWVIPWHCNTGGSYEQDFDYKLKMPTCGYPGSGFECGQYGNECSNFRTETCNQDAYYFTQTGTKSNGEPIYSAKVCCVLFGSEYNYKLAVVHKCSRKNPLHVDDGGCDTSGICYFVH